MRTVTLRRGTWRLRALVVVAAAVAAVAGASGTAAAQPPDFAAPNGWFYSQTGSGDGSGYIVSNDDGIPFWTTFYAAGGVAQLGYPVSTRWTDGPFTLQAFQKGILQWLDGRGVRYLNIYDDLSAAGHDAWLDSAKSVPVPWDFPRPPDEPFDATIARHLELLELNLDIKARWFERANWIDLYGLPVAYDDRGGLRVLRAQRAVFQQWMIDTDFSDPGDVVIANGGDHFKQAGLIPEAATAPIAAPNPSAGRIAFLSNRDGPWDLYTMAQDGTDTRRLTVGAAVNGRAVWSPDGTKIAFASFRFGNFDVFVINADGTDLRQLTVHQSTDWEPAWSPDGETILFISMRTGSGGLHAVSPTGGEVTRFSDRLGKYCYPVYSPDGTRLTYRFGTQVTVADVAGFDSPDHVQTPLAEGTQPAWSPDGSRIVFARFVDGSYEIFTIGADGSAETRLTTSPVPDWTPIWSPDGSRITFARFVGGDWELFHMNVDGSGLTQVTDNDGHDMLPVWSPV